MNAKSKELEDFKHKMIDDFIIKSDEDEIKTMFNQLTRKCVLAYINDEQIVYNQYFELIQELSKSFSKTFTNIFDYVNYCFLKNINDLLNEMMSRDFKLKTIHKASLRNGTKDESILIHNDHAMKFIQRNMDYNLFISNTFNTFNFNRRRTISHEDEDNIKRLYEICSSDENLDQEIVSIANELYDSFMKKEGEYLFENQEKFFLYLKRDPQVVKEVQDELQKHFEYLDSFKKR